MTALPFRREVAAAPTSRAPPGASAAGTDRRVRPQRAHSSDRWARTGFGAFRWRPPSEHAGGPLLPRPSGSGRLAKTARLRPACPQLQYASRPQPRQVTDWACCPRLRLMPESPRSPSWLPPQPRIPNSRCLVPGAHSVSVHGAVGEQVALSGRSSGVRREFTTVCTG